MTDFIGDRALIPIGGGAHITFTLDWNIPGNIALELPGNMRRITLSPEQWREAIGALEAWPDRLPLGGSVGGTGHNGPSSIET